VSRTWVDIGSDVNWIDYGGRWARHIDGTRYHVIRFENMAEYSREQTGYVCELLEVDTTDSRLDSARECCGYAADWCDDYGKPLPEACKVDALVSYGAYSMLSQDSGKNAHKLVRAAKRYSR
jgi:hypothetical protein